MPDTETQYTFDRVVRIILGAVTLVVVLALLRYLSDVLLPFAAAVVVAYLLNPLVTYLERKTKRRGAAVAITIIGLGIVGLVLAAIVLPLMIGQGRAFGDALGKLRDDWAMSVELSAEPGDVSTETTDVSDTGTALIEKSATGWRELKEGWTQYRREAETLSRSERLANLREQISGTYIGDLLDRIIEYTKSEEFNKLLVDAAKRIAIGGWTVVAFVINLVLGLTGLIIVLLYLVFLLLDFPEYARTWKTFLPPQYRKGIVDFWDQFSMAMRRYFRGQAVVALSVGILLAAGFSFIGLPMAIPFGLFVGLLNMVPYLQMVGLVPAMLLAGMRAVEGDSSFIASVVLTLLVFAVVQVIQDAIITPRVMGKATGLRPVAILLGLFIWGKLLGFLGLLLAIPLTCLGIAYYRRYVLLHAPESGRIQPEG
ncbi:MAG: AI-2E family transporter [Phycisphaerales bacterium]|nr:MAG: AI-2E family transporter [Phycisphaerales bacterium]